MNIALTKSLLYLTLILSLGCGNGGANSNTDKPPTPVTEIPDITGMTVKGRVQDNTGKNLQDVMVTDGVNVTLTDKNGVYYLPTDLNARRFVYITVPKGYEMPSSNGVPEFFSRLTLGRVNLRNFTLVPRTEDAAKHTIIMMADTQIRSAQKDNSIARFRDPVTPDIAATVASVEGPCYGVVLGDLVWDEMDLFAEYKQQVERMGMTVFNILGNHDHDQNNPGDEDSILAYESHFGPSNYSFNIGDIHYVMLDNVIYTNYSTYSRGLTDEIVSWLEKDMLYVRKGSTVVVGMHIPLRHSSSLTYDNSFANRDKFLEILKDYKVHVFSGHRHFNEYFHDAERGMDIHLCGRPGGHPTICGDYCQDGSPSGYAIVEVDGSELKWKYKAIGGGNENYQLSAFVEGGKVYANVWLYDTKWGDVEWWENNTFKAKMLRTSYPDQNYAKEYKAYHNQAEAAPIQVWHMFAVTPSAGVNSGTIKVTDRFGNDYERTVSW